MKIKIPWQFSLTVTIFLMVSVGFAKQNQQENNLDNWSGDAQLGFVLNTGNTRSTNSNGQLNLVYNKLKWNNDLNLTGEYNTSKGITSANRYKIYGESRYLLQKKEFVFANAEYIHDHFSPYVYSFTPALGYGLQIFKSVNNQLTIDVQAGPGMRLEKINNLANSKRQQFILYSAGTLLWKISQATKFSERLSVAFAQPNTVTRSVTALNMKIIGNLGMQVSYRMEYDTNIPPESKDTIKLDTTTNLALVYNF